MAVLFICSLSLLADVRPALTVTSAPLMKRSPARTSTPATDVADVTAAQGGSTSASGDDDDDVLLLVDHPDDSEKELFKREEISGSPPERGMWFGPRMGRSTSTLGDRGRRGYEDESELSGGMWFGPRMGRSSNTISDIKPQQHGVDGMWFGHRMGRSSFDIIGSKSRRGFPDESEVSSSSGMWFGPRMGRSSDVVPEGKQQAAVGMWFGPRMGRSLEFDSYVDDRDPEKDGKFLLVFRRQLPTDVSGRHSLLVRKRLGSMNIQDTKKKDSDGHESALGGMWFGPRMGRKREVEWDEAGMKGSGGRDPGMWFGPRLG